MNVYCTYCSRKKDSTPRLLPAIERYNSTRIKGIYEKATIDNVELFILSGKFGFIHCETKIPCYDFCLKSNQVPEIVVKLKWQLANYGISHLAYFTELPEDDPLLKPYKCAIEQACKAADVKFEKHFWTKEG